MSLWYARMRRRLFATSAYSVARGHHGLVCLHLSFAAWLGTLLVVAQHNAVRRHPSPSPSPGPGPNPNPYPYPDPNPNQVGQLGVRHHVVQHMQMALRRWSYRAIATKVLRAQHRAQQEEGWPERPHSPVQF